MSALDPFGATSWVANQVVPGAGDWMHEQYAKRPASAALGSMATPAAMEMAPLTALHMAARFAPKTTTAAGALGLTMVPSEAGDIGQSLVGPPQRPWWM
jgi:hypothetical protein